MPRKAQLEAAITVTGAEKSAAEIGAFSKSMSKAGAAAVQGDAPIKSLTGSVRTMASGFVAANPELAAMAVGVGAAVLAVKASVGAFTDAASKVRAFERVSGASAETSSKFVYALDAVGISADSGATAMFMLGKKIGQGKDVLDKYGVSVATTKDGTRDLTGTVMNVADAWKAMKDPAEKAALVQDAFGKGGKSMLPILAKSREGIKHLFDEADRTHSIFSPKDLDNAREFGLAVHGLSETMSGFGREVGSQVTPSLTDITVGLTDLLQTADDVGAIKAFGDAVQLWLAPLQTAGNLVHSLSVALGGSSNHMDKASLAQKIITDNTKIYNEEVAKGVPTSRAAKDALDQIAQASRITTTAQAGVAGAFETMKQKAADADKALQNLKTTFLGFGDSQRSVQKSIIDYGAAQDHVKDAVDALNTAQATGIQQGETQEQYNRRIAGLQRDVQTAVLGVADANDAVVRAQVTALTSQQNLDAAMKDPAAKAALLAQLQAVQAQFGDPTGAVAGAIAQLQNYNATPVNPKTVVVETADAHKYIQALQGALDSLHGTTVWETVQARGFTITVDPQGGVTRHDIGGGAPGYILRAEGGPVKRGEAYIVGEKRPEVFVPKEDGSIVPSVKKWSASQVGMLPPPTGTGNTVTNSYSIDVRVPVGADPAEVGRQTVNQIAAYERISGASWRAPVPV